MIRRLAALALAAALAAPCAAAARPVGAFEWIVVAPADQTKPSIDGAQVVYADRSRGDWDVVRYDLERGTITVVAAGPGDEDSPDVFRSVIAYRAPGGIQVYSVALESTLRYGAEPGIAGAPATSDRVTAWEEGSPGERDVAWVRFVPDPPREGAVALPGDQHAPAVFGLRVAYVDDAAGGSVRLLDVESGDTITVCEGRAFAISLGARPDGTLVAAVARAAPGGDPDVELHEPGAGLVAALRVEGEQRNPHLSGDWVAFEDLSTGRSQVVLWNAATGLVFVPHPSESEQILNDVSASGDAVRVVFADDAHGDLDIALYTLPLPFDDDGAPAGWPPAPPPPPPPAAARCDDPAAVPLAVLALARGDGKPQVGEARFSPGRDAPVLVCVDAAGVASAWVSLDGERLAAPSDFSARPVHLERRARVAPGGGLVAGSVAGKPDATLRVRVLADPPPAPASPTRAAASVAAPAAAAFAGSGCGTGGAGPLALLAVVALALRRGTRR